jgi:hypothetical protein
LTVSTDPFLSPRTFASSAAATLPASTLSEETSETAIDGSSSVVSTRTTLMPWSAAFLRGANSALLSVGAMTIASGFLAIIASRIGICAAGSKDFGACVSTIAPRDLAAASIPHWTEP